MKALLISFFLLSACLDMASAEINVSGADMTYNASLIKADIQTPPQPVSSIFIYNDNGNGNSSLEPVQIPTAPLALSRIFSWNEASINVRPLEQGSIPTNKTDLRQIFVVHEFARYQKDLAYPKDLFNDSAPPAITDIVVDNILSSEARINWTTDEFATSLVKYSGFPDEYETSKRDTLFTKNHSIPLDGLLPETRYYFAVNSTDRSGNSAEANTSEFETSGPLS
jgi:hypothetical protein